MPLTNYKDQSLPVISAAWLNAVDQILNGNGTPGFGVYESAFQFGYIQYVGPNNNGQGNPLANNLTGNTNLGFGLNVPNPSGINAPALLLGSGVPQAWLLTDAVLSGTPGINLGITAGSAASPSADAGGALSLYAGAGYNGIGGLLLLQGGTSVNGQAGNAQVQGGNSTSGEAGNVFILGGQLGPALGGSVHLIASQPPGCTLANAGSVYFRSNSVILMQLLANGTINVNTSGIGTAGQFLMSQGASGPVAWAGNSAVTGFQAALSGGMVAPYNLNLNYRQTGNMMTVTQDGNTNPPIGTSNSNSDLIISNLPATLMPANERWVFCANLAAGSTLPSIGVARVLCAASTPPGPGIIISLIQNSGFGSYAAVPNTWPPSNQKGLGYGWTISYPLN